MKLARMYNLNWPLRESNGILLRLCHVQSEMAMQIQRNKKPTTKRESPKYLPYQLHRRFVLMHRGKGARIASSVVCAILR